MASAETTRRDLIEAIGEYIRDQAATVVLDHQLFGRSLAACNRRQHGRRASYAWEAARVLDRLRSRDCTAAYVEATLDRIDQRLAAHDPASLFALIDEDR